MGKFIFRRLLQGIPTLLGITILSYAIMSAAPGGPTAALNFSPRSTPQQQEQMRERLGIDDPVIVQYFRWLLGNTPWKACLSTTPDALISLVDGIAGVRLPDHTFGCTQVWDGQIPFYEQTRLEPGDYTLGILRGDLGRSFTLKKPVSEVISERLYFTLELTGLSLIFGLLIGVPLGILSAVWQGSIFDNMVRVLAVIANAVPGFWLGIMLLLFFGSYLGWLPMGNRCPITFSSECEATLAIRAKHLALPVTVLATGWIAGFSRYMRASMLDVLSSDYIRTAKAKGLTNSKVWFVHAARNALIPIATFLGPAIPGLLGGAVITETIFSWPGLGRTYITAVGQQDFPIVMGLTLLGAAGTILGYLLSDVLYAFIDPRIRLS